MCPAKESTRVMMMKQEVKKAVKKQEGRKDEKRSYHDLSLPIHIQRATPKIRTEKGEVYKNEAIKLNQIHRVGFFINGILSENSRSWLQGKLIH
jgi:hypothetical protein